MIEALAPARVSIAVLPSVLMPGDAIRVTCTVPKHPDNRRLLIALPGYSSSDRPIDGSDAAITHRMIFQHVPCDVELAACVVVDNLGKEYPATTQIRVAGCDGGPAISRESAKR